MTTRLASLLLALAATAVAQAPPAPAGQGTSPELSDLGAPADLPDGAPPHLARIDRAGLRRHAYWLADDARGGRHTTSSGQAETVKYVTDHFKKLGLKPLGEQKGYLQRYPLQRTWLDEGSLSFAATKLERDLAVVAAEDAKVQLAGKFVWCGNGSPASVPGGLAGKIPVVVITGGGDGAAAGNDLQALQRYSDIARQLDKQGASAGVVCLLADTGPFGNALTTRAFLPDHARVRYGGGGGTERGLPAKVPLLVLSAGSSKPLLEHLGVALDGDGKPQAPTNDKATGKVSIVVKADDKGVGTNVVAVLEGTGKKTEAVVFSAHHDHIGRRLDGDVFNGADDNASGTSGLLELAEAFAQGGARPARSIIFLSVSGEELGLWGSDWYSAHPTWPLDKIVADVNIDMIGRAGGGDGAIAMQVTPSHQHEKYSTIVRESVALAKHFGITFSSGDTYYKRSDHYNFAKVGVPVVFFCDGEHPDYHQVTDTADRLDYVKMEAIVRLAFWTGWQVANGKGRPQELGQQQDW